MPGDEKGACPCGHRDAMCHRANARSYCPEVLPSEIAELVQDKALLLTLLTETQMDEYRRRRDAVRDGVTL